MNHKVNGQPCSHYTYRQPKAIKKQWLWTLAQPMRLHFNCMNFHSFFSTSSHQLHPTFSIIFHYFVFTLLLLHPRPDGRTHITVPPQNVRIEASDQDGGGVKRKEKRERRNEIGGIGVGDVVTITYEDTSHQRAQPVNAIIVRRRLDLHWPQVVLNHLRQLPRSQSLNSIAFLLFVWYFIYSLFWVEYSGGGEEFTSKPLRFWTAAQGKNMREWLVTFANDRGIDPLVADSWYHFPRKEIEKIKVHIPHR